MAVCVECEKKVGILSGFKHPIKGNKHIVCSTCYDVVETQVARNLEQVLLQSQMKDIDLDHAPVLEYPNIEADQLTKWLR